MTEYKRKNVWENLSLEQEKEDVYKRQQMACL